MEQRLIDANALKNAFSNMYREDYERWIKEVIDNAPTVEQSPVIGEVISFVERDSRPKGKWIFSGVEHTADNPIDSDSYYCSVCKRSISTTLTRPTDLFPFCHCGADMRGEE